MSDLQKPNSTEKLSSTRPSSSSSSSSNGVYGEKGGGSESSLKVEKPHKIHYPNPPETEIPDPSTLREQWRFAIRQYSKWYSHAWGTAILAGGAFFALGWIIKGSNPLPSLQRHDSEIAKSEPERKPSSDRTWWDYEGDPNSKGKVLILSRILGFRLFVCSPFLTSCDMCIYSGDFLAKKWYCE